jgi:glutaredoxin
MLSVTLYTKAGCGLCDEVKDVLDGLQASQPHQLTEVDITQDTALFEKYRFTIPVVQVGSQVLSAPITAVQLQQALKSVSP